METEKEGRHGSITAIDPVSEAGKSRGRYTIYGKFQVIDLLRLLGIAIPFCIGNIIKYLIRSINDRNLYDLKKAQHYMDMLVRLVEREERDKRQEEKRRE